MAFSKSLFPLPKRGLSHRSAQRCEDALEEKCDCRCAGRFHGAKRGPVSKLKVGDPHSLIRICFKCRGTGKKFGLAGTIYSCPKCKGKGIIEPKKPAEPIKPVVWKKEPVRSEMYEKEL